jgi:hypothetical protein
VKLLFLDESGDHIDPQYPLFVLGGVIVDKDYAASVSTSARSAAAASSSPKSVTPRLTGNSIWLG